MGDRKTQTTPVLSSTAVSAAVETDAMYVADYTEAIVCIDVTVAGTTVSPVVQCSHDGADWFGITATWTKEDATTVTALVATGKYIAAVTNFGNYLRVNIPTPTGAFTMEIIIQAKN
jgi:hypothetical protein